MVEDRVTSNTLADASGGVDVERHMVDIGILGAAPILVPASKTSAWRFSYGTVNYRFVGPPPPPSSPKFPVQKTELQLFIRLFSAIGQELSKVARQEAREGFIAHLSGSIQEQIKVRIEEDNGEHVAPPK